jgi:hypothetical protein
LAATGTARASASALTPRGAAAGMAALPRAAGASAMAVMRASFGAGDGAAWANSTGPAATRLSSRISGRWGVTGVIRS